MIIGCTQYYSAPPDYQHPDLLQFYFVYNQVLFILHYELNEVSIWETYLKEVASSPPDWC